MLRDIHSKPVTIFEQLDSFHRIIIYNIWRYPIIYVIMYVVNHTSTIFLITMNNRSLEVFFFAGLTLKNKFMFLKFNIF